MADAPLLRVAVVGATGAVGREVLDLLEARRFPLREILPIATERSLGETVEMLGQEVPVLTEVSSLEGLDLVLVCTPREQALAWVRIALDDRVACIDLSGASAVAPEVPLLSADLPLDAAQVGEPVVASPSGAALAWTRVLAPVRERCGLRRILATHLEGVAEAGRAGIETLQAETIALFNQREPPEPMLFRHGIAFDCLPFTGTSGGEGRTAAEELLVGHLGRLLGGKVPAAVTCVRVPIFAGSAASLALETEAALAPEECAELLAKRPGVRVWSAAAPGPSTREAVGGEDVHVGRVRRDPTNPAGLLLWLAADPIRLSASNALRIAETRFQAF